MIFDNTHATVNLDAIAANYRAIRERAGVPVMAVVKADAYGHGAVPVALHLQEICGFFGVSSMQEALELRRAGIRVPILILGRIPASALETAVREQIRPSVFRYEDAVALSEAAVKLGVDAPFHFAVDTGMSRIGFQAVETDADLCAAICRLPGLIPEGLFSHFATADEADLRKARIQVEKFDAFHRMLQDRGVQVKLRHMNNSAGIINFENRYEMVRAGIILYGMYPSDEVEKKNLEIQPALEWSSRITHVKTLEPGREVSYGGTYVTTRETVVATVPVGYADGYRRALSGKFHVLLRGQFAPIIGRICMDQMMVDVTDIPDVRVDDRVVLIGTDGERSVSMEEIAETAGSFNYEFVCGISRRVPRFYQQGGKIVRQVHHLLDKVE